VREDLFCERSGPPCNKCVSYVLVLLGRKRTLADLRAAPWWVTFSAARSIKVRKKTGQTDEERDGHQTIALRLLLDAASVISLHNSCFIRQPSHQSIR